MIKVQPQNIFKIYFGKLYSFVIPTYVYRTYSHCFVLQLIFRMYLQAKRGNPPKRPRVAMCSGMVPSNNDLQSYLAG